MRRFRETDLASPIENGQVVRVDPTARALR